MRYFVIIEYCVVYVCEVFSPNFEVLYVDVVWSCRVVVFVAYDCCLDLLGCDVYLSWM